MLLISPSLRHYTLVVRNTDIVLFFYHGATSLVSLGFLIVEDSWLHSDTPHSVGLHRTSDETDAETSNW